MNGRTIGLAILWLVVASSAASTFAHSLVGWPEMANGLARSNADAELVGSLWAGWFFGSIAFAVYAAIVAWCLLRIIQGDRGSLIPVIAIGVGLLVFGFVGFVIRDFATHFVAFILAGILTLAGCWLVARSSGP